MDTDLTGSASIGAQAIQLSRIFVSSSVLDRCLNVSVRDCRRER
jgi:hypothetical protein